MISNTAGGLGALLFDNTARWASGLLGRGELCALSLRRGPGALLCLWVQLGNF